jgi:hypothetical protein
MPVPAFGFWSLDFRLVSARLVCARAKVPSMIYLDHNATTAGLPEVFVAMRSLLLRGVGQCVERLQVRVNPNASVEQRRHEDAKA